MGRVAAKASGAGCAHRGDAARAGWGDEAGKMGGNLHYSVSEMASMFDLSRQTLIYYDKIGLFSPAEKNEAGYRLYLPAQIPALRLICTMRELGLSLGEIAAVVADHEPSRLLERLPEQRERIDRQIERLVAQRDFIDQRTAFYQDVVYWQGREGEPCVRSFPERRVVFEPFPALKMQRDLLHPTLSRAIKHLHAEAGVEPVAGFGAMLTERGIDGGTLAGAGSFVVVPGGVRPPDDALALPAGDYACLARRGMPYDMPEVARLMDWAHERGLEPAGNVFDFCLLDTTSYGEGAAEDFCVAQVRVE